MRRVSLVSLLIVGLLATGCASQSRDAAPAVEESADVPSVEASRLASPEPESSAESNAPLAAVSGSESGSCGQKATCRIGDVGPGGGTVFYDAGSPQTWGRFLEVAPRGWSGASDDPKATWCDKAAQWAIPKASSRDGIGEGLGNTDRLFEIQPCAAGTAMFMARAYRGSGLNDWYLPSKDEVSALYSARGKVPSIGLGWFWSSSRSSNLNAWSSNFLNGGSSISAAFPSMFEVRPIRAF